MPKVSVLSMTYNRAKLLRRLYQSLCASSFKDFEWIVVNDGSADDTDQVMEELIKDSTFPVIYFKHEVNKGLPAVYNKLFELSRGEYSIIIADDDELLPEALEKAVQMWERIPADKRSCFASVGGRCIDAKSGMIVGDLYPDNVNEVSFQKRKKIFINTKGEKIGLERTELLKRNSFPEVKGVYWIPESCFWRKAYEQYDLFLTNEPFRIYHQNEGESICTTGRTRKAYKNKYYCNKFLLGGGQNWVRIPLFCRERLRYLAEIRSAAEHLKIPSGKLYAGLGIWDCIFLVYTKPFYVLKNQLRKRRWLKD